MHTKPVTKIDGSGIAKLAIDGMAAMYLSDPRVSGQSSDALARAILKNTGRLSRLVYRRFKHRQVDRGRSSLDK